MRHRTRPLIRRVQFATLSIVFLPCHKLAKLPVKTLSRLYQVPPLKFPPARGSKTLTARGQRKHEPNVKADTWGSDTEAALHGWGRSGTTTPVKILSVLPPAHNVKKTNTKKSQERIYPDRRGLVGCAHSSPAAGLLALPRRGHVETPCRCSPT